MGNLQSSLSSHSQEILDAALNGNAVWIKRQISGDSQLIESVATAKGLVKRRGVLHLAAKQGHADVISTVLDPLVERVREEYKAQQERLNQGNCDAQQELQYGQQQPEHQQQQQQNQTAVVQGEARQSTSEVQQTQAEPRIQQEQQLPSFRLLRQTVNARDLYRRTPLIIAAKRGHLDCSQLLVEGAANLFAVDREGNTCLHYAALHGHLHVVEYLLQKARDRNLATRFANKRNLSGFTPLHYAVWGANEQIVLHMLQVGADVSVANDRVFDAWVTVPVGSTPLHLAVVRNHMPIALMLLQHYVLQLVATPSDIPAPEDPRYMTNLYGMTPSQLAAHRGYRQLARVLMPTLSLSRVLEAFEPDAPRAYGPPSLKAIAAGVMKTKLTADLQDLEQAQREQQQASAAHLDASSRAALSAAAAVTAGVAADVCCSLNCAGTAVCSDSSCCCSRSGSVGSSSLDGMLSRSSSSSVASRTSSGDLLGSFGVLQTNRSFKSVDAVMASATSAGMSCSSSADGVAASVCRDPVGAELGRASSSGWYDEQCCVCWEEGVSVTIGPCMHALCLGCAKQLVESSGRAGATCPLCRRYIGSFGALPMPGSGQKLKLLAGAGI